jgi:hypothetical protein
MKTLVFILLFLLPQQDLEYKRGIPTSKGVDNYVEANELQFVLDFQTHVNDTLFYEPFICTEDLTKYYDYNDGEAGYFERPDLVLINNKSNYIDYELRLLSKYRKSKYREANMFVRSVVMHELCHAYIYQLKMLAQHQKVLEYEWQQGIRMLPVDNYYTEFIEEGICEYLVQDMEVSIAYDQQLFLIKDDLKRARRNTYEIKYRYSSQYVAPVIEELGLKQAILLFIGSKPPSQEEILSPKLYYDRLKQN